jgi:hypothetical protein
VRKRSIKILTLLSASFPSRAVVDALMDTRTLSKADLFQLIDELKKASADDRHPKRKPTQRGDGSPAARIRRLLTVEAALSSTEAIDQLRTELAKVPGLRLPPSTRVSLDHWLDAVISLVPAGEVLNAAMMIAERHRRG